MFNKRLIGSWFKKWLAIGPNEISKLVPTKLFFLRQVSKLGQKYSWCPDSSSSWPGSSSWLSPPPNLKTGTRTMIKTRPKDYIIIKVQACTVVISIILHHRSLILPAKACSPLTLPNQGNSTVCWLFANCIILLSSLQTSWINKVCVNLCLLSQRLAASNSL